MVKIKELYEICRVHGGNDSWYDRLFVKKIAVLITWVLIHTPITANQVTFIHTVLGIFGAGLFFMNNQTYNIIGLIFILSGFLLDRVDGQVARYRKVFSHRGYFMDLCGHNVQMTLLFTAITINSYWKFDNVLFIFLGFSALAFWFSYRSMYTTRYFFLYEELKKERLSSPKKEIATKGKTSNSPFFYLIQFINNKIFQNIILFGMMLILLTVFSITDRLELFLIIYGVLFPVYYFISFAYLYFFGLKADLISWKKEIIGKK